MGEANNVFHVFMSRPERVRSVLEYFWKEHLPDDWVCSDADGFYAVRNRRGKVSYRQRDIMKRITTSQGSYLLGIENQKTVNLIPMRWIPNKDLERMDSDLKYVLGLMKCGNSRVKYERYIREHREYFSRIPKSAADVLDVCLGIHNLNEYLEYRQGSEEEEADMCKALDDIEKYAEKRGRRQGQKQGQKQGMQCFKTSYLRSIRYEGVAS